MTRTSIGVISVQDSHGRIAVGSAQDPDSPIRLGGLFDADGNSINDYIGPAKNVKAWAKRNNLECKIHQLELDLDSQALLSWQIIP
jgi:hypothetical protein